ncbi:hypothetical protein L6164_023181 [Bauhinia variegata]|uniref:Uncharacterized protein n=1 Tax=Bauhinia variegata TaxID=167791 RepID=A0ACB9MHR6_BAUVA|nr:hypothetical protein L6164_023181 [Bauhinia variegata]
MSPTVINEFPKKQSIEGEEKLTQECKELLLSLPRERGWRTPYLYLYQGFWCQPAEIQAISTFQKHFQAKNSDIVVASIPKSGTTWLKALTFAIVNRHRFASSKNHSLLTFNPHDLVPFFEYKLYEKNQVPDLSNLPEPRLFSTHVPFPSLPSSMKKSNCKIVYICRNPFDTFVSSWHFSNKIKPGSSPQLTLEETFELYCKGVVGFGPFWTHMLGYWKESLERPNKVLFLTYEDLKRDIYSHLKRMAKFLDCPFTLEEERGGVIEELIELCSFEKMKELEVNKSGKSIKNFENKNLFRKGEIGDWVNHFSPWMVEKLSKVIEEKLGESSSIINVTIHESLDKIID